MSSSADITVIRRRNALSLFREFAEARVAAGAAPKGLEQEFAKSLEISPSLWSQIKSSRPIGDKLARQIETHARKPSGWLDQARETTTLTPAEQHFLAQSLAAYRRGSSSDRKRLRALIHGWPDAS